jgi:hypothetical protein
MPIFRYRFVFSVICSTLAVWAACLAVSDPGNTTGTPGSTSWELLLNDADVRKELNVTDEQTKKLQQDFKAVRDDVLGKYRNYKAPNAADAAAKASEALEKIYDQSDKSIAKVLTAEQAERLKQIDRQQRGLLAQGTRKALQLTAEQTQQIQKIQDDLDKDYRQVTRKFALDRKSRVASWQELRKQAVDKEIDVLTAEQRKLWKDLSGEPFDLLKFAEVNGVDPKIAVTPPPVARPAPYWRPVFPVGNT